MSGPLVASSSIAASAAASGATAAAGVGPLKLVEAGLLLAAGVGFAWWQLRDVERALQASRARRKSEAAAAASATAATAASTTTAASNPEPRR